MAVAANDRGGRTPAGLFPAADYPGSGCGRAWEPAVNSGDLKLLSSHGSAGLIERRVRGELSFLLMSANVSGPLCVPVGLQEGSFREVSCIMALLLLIMLT